MRDFLANGLIRAPRTARILLIPSRVWTAAQYQRDTVKTVLKWAFTSRETTNFTYDITKRNKDYLAWFVSAVSGCDKKSAANYILELEDDSVLRSHLRRSLQAARFNYKADAEPQYGRRLGWYALVRLKRPKIVVETGTDKVLGSAVIAAALLKNAAEGFPGRLYTIDLNPQAGWLLKDPYSQCAAFINDDSLNYLSTCNHQIDIFVNDSDHSAEHERSEYEMIDRKLTSDSLVLGDNSHCTTELLEFAERTNRRFLFFREEPENHWYPGGGIGIACSSDSGCTRSNAQ